MSLLITAGCSNTISDSGESTSNTIAQTPIVDLSATLIALPARPNVETSRLVLQAFFDAYNRRDVEDVLITLSETFAYSDCNTAAHHMFVFEKKDDLAVWLQAKFAEGDQCLVEKMILAPTEGSPPNQPRSTAVLVNRTNRSLKNGERQAFL